MNESHQSTIKHKLLLLFLFFSGCLFVFTAYAETTLHEPTRVTFGIVPQQSATKLAKNWTPILNYLSKKTGYRIDFATAKDIPTFENRCNEGAYDFAYMNPYHYTMFHKSVGYNAFAREKLKSLKGILVTKKNSPYTRLDDLTGTLIAFPSPGAFAASMITQSHLSRLGIHITPKYVLSHDSVYRTVEKGLYVAGGGIPRTFNSLDPETKAKLRIIWVSKGYTSHAFAFHPRVSGEIVDKIRKAMIEMNDDHEGKKLLGKISFQGLVTAVDSDWDDIRNLDIDTFKEKQTDK